MASLPWITFASSPSGNAITYYEPCVEFSTNLSTNSRPSIVTAVGKKSKTVLLEKILGSTASLSVHKSVYLWSSSTLHSGSTPLLVVDCNLQNTYGVDACNVAAQHAISWPIENAGNISATFCRVLSPFSSVVCCFVSDLGGPRAVAKWLACQAVSPPASDLLTVPRLLLVVDTSSDTFDESIAADKSALLLCEAMHTLKLYSDEASVQNDIKLHFKGIEVLGLNSSRSTSVRARALKRRLYAMSDASMRERSQTRADFRFAHFQALSKKALSHFSRSPGRTFHFAGASRPHGFSGDLFQPCLQDFLQQLPSQAWLWHFAAPIVASALLLASYPPSSHGKLKHPVLPSAFTTEMFTQ